MQNRNSTFFKALEIRMNYMYILDCDLQDVWEKYQYFKYLLYVNFDDIFVWL